MSTSTTATSRPLFVTLPVQDVARTTAFFEQLGFEFDPRFSDGGNGGGMRLDEHAYVMFVAPDTYAKYAKRPAADPRTHSLGLFTFAVPTREEVDTVTEAAIAAGAEDHDDADDHGFMYSRSFFDLDGHGWQVMWMDPEAG